MKKNIIQKLVLGIILIITIALGTICYADNPIIQTIYTADPAPMVHEGIVYLYTGHDEDNAPNNRYLMHDYRCFTSTDMVNWTDLGMVLDIHKVFTWSGGDANAAQCIYRNGKFYYYVSTANTKGPSGVALGVAVSDSPTGPFKDPLGKALVTNNQTTYARHNWDDLDPSVFIDDDGRAFLYWGNNACYFAELNEDMISLKSDISAVPLNEETFGPDFEEAPWLYKRNNMYYLIYASGLPESIGYSTSNSPTGPWAFQKIIMTKPLQRGLNTSHPGIIDYKGSSYLFYHSAALPNGGDKRRGVCIEQFTYNEDGSIPEMKITETGVTEGIAKLNPFIRTEAETIAWESDIETEVCSEGGMNVCEIENGDYIKVEDVNFDTGAASFEARVASATSGGNIEIRLDSLTGALVGTFPVSSTGDWQKWETKSCAISEAKGVHDLYFKFSGESGHLFSFNWWKFSKNSN